MIVIKCNICHKELVDDNYYAVVHIVDDKRQHICDECWKTNCKIESPSSIKSQKWSGSEYG